MGAEGSVRQAPPDGTDDAEGGSRIVRAAGGMRWRATVVARLLSDDPATGRERARLVLRFECLGARRRLVRASLPGVASLEDVPDAALRALIESVRSGRPAARGARARARKR